MGLTLHYKFAAPVRVASTARSLVEALRRYAQSLAFTKVSDLIELEGDDCCFDRPNRDATHSLLAVQAIRVETHLQGNEINSATVCSPSHLIAFTVDPADGSEPANFGLCQYPGSEGWSWSSFCKTQYASNPSAGDVANFLQCHLGLIAVLDKAKELGILESVHDEGKYWESRDVPALVREVGIWNSRMAGFYGKFKDTMEAAGEDITGLEAEISNFGNFERLEMEGWR